MKETPRPGQVNRLITDKNIGTVQELNLQNRHIQLEEIEYRF